jgi:hypothetical protein
MAAGEIVFDGVTTALTDDAARALYGIASDGSRALDTARQADASFPVNALGQAVT